MHTSQYTHIQIHVYDQNIQKYTMDIRHKQLRKMVDKARSSWWFCNVLRWILYNWQETCKSNLSTLLIQPCMLTFPQKRIQILIVDHWRCRFRDRSPHGPPGTRAHGHATDSRAHGHTRNPRAHGHTRNPRAHGHTGLAVQRPTGTRAHEQSTDTQAQESKKLR